MRTLGCADVFRVMAFAQLTWRESLRDIEVCLTANYVMDRGYLDYERLYAIHQAGAFFVTRAKKGMDARRVYSAPTDRPGGVSCSSTISNRTLLK